MDRMMLAALAAVVVLGFVFLLTKAKRGAGAPSEREQLLPETAYHSGRRDLVTKLEALGFYKYTAPERIEELKREAIAGGYLFGWDVTKRDYHADAEDLAEGGIAKFIERIRPFLESQGVRIRSVKEEDLDRAYYVTINNVRYVMYSEDEIDENIWDSTTRRCFAAINRLLEEAGSDERLHWLYGGNDNRAIFLTQAMYEAIRDSKTLPRREMPMPAITAEQGK